MAAYHQDSEIREWSSHRSKSRSSTPSPLTDRAKFESTEASRDMESYSMEHRPLLRSHKTYPYVPRPLIPSSQNRQPSIERREPPYPMTYASTANLRTGVDDLESGCASAVPLSRSAPGSPISRLTPTSAEEDEGDAEDEDDLEVNMVEHDESGNVPRTAAELRAEKRKMKRFR
ncbi:MAG: hypothetical protein M1827_005865 [Pycnora praestabilis]|nr:MAG: hypothetical protein M1827_005865 [Pycnora praestabilis]